MKKLNKIIIILTIIVLLVVIAFFAYRMYSAKILIEVANNVDNFQNETGDFAYRITTNYYKTSSTSAANFIKKDDTYVRIIEENEEKYTEWYNLKANNLDCNYYRYELDSKENIDYAYGPYNHTSYIPDIKYNIAISTGMDVIYMDNWNNDNEIIAYIKNAISPTLNTFLYIGDYEGEKCYIYKQGNQYETYISKEKMLPIAFKIYDNDGIHALHMIEYNIEVNEEILKEPDIYEFDNAYYHDSNFAECNFISNGTEIPEDFVSFVLEDSLIENIDLKENESLDFFKLKEDNQGLKKIKINRYETYEKFRKKYSNLEKLTEKDFNYYYVTIIYKSGYKLEHIDTVKSAENFITNYVFSEEESDADNIVVIITPKYEEYQFNVILSNEKIAISSEKAFEIYNENIDVIKQKNNISKEVVLGSKSDKIVKLDKKTYSKLNYIQMKPKDSEEPICYEIIDDVLEENDNLGEIKTYINAMTGELVGTIYNK